MTEDSEAVTETVACDLVRKATEALAKDVGRGLARLDPADMSLTGIAPGDVIRLTGKRATVAKAMPAPRWANGCGCSAPTTVPPRRSDWRRSPRRVTPAKKMKITMSDVSSRAWYWSRAIVSARR